MKSLISMILCLLAASFAPLAAAQGCGSGGGASVCLTASGTPDDVQLTWTVSGRVTGLEVYRDTDANPAGRSRIAALAASARSYADASAVTGTRYWYWVRFKTNAGIYNSGAASASRGAACAATAVTPWIAVDGAWTNSASAVVDAGKQVALGPQAAASGGSWTWNGCGTSGAAREQSFVAGASCSATATYTNSCGAKTQQGFALTVPGTMRELTSVQLSKLMSPGWNLGNSLDASPNETGWGNPLVNQTLLNAVKAAGFKTVRIPVSWTLHVDANDNIDPAWMARVAQVVQYARNAGLFAIINLHHEGHWLNHTTYDRQAANNARLARLWTQIANHFKHQDDHLLFAGLNEVGKENAPWGVFEQEWADVQNSYNQTFVNTVRASGGNNAKRHLVVQGYFTNIDQTLAKGVLPTDTVAGRLFMELHYYDPWNFALNDQSPIWQWGAIATDPAVTETWANEAYVDAQFQKLKARYVDAGVPVLLGEYGAILKAEYDPAGTYRTYWTQYVTKSAVQHGIVPVWWDNGYPSNHQFGLFNRSTGAQYFPDLISTIVNATK